MKIKFQTPIKVEGLSEKVNAFRNSVAERRANDEFEDDLLDEYDAARVLLSAKPTDTHRQNLVNDAMVAIQNHYNSDTASKSFKRRVDRIQKDLAEEAQKLVAEQMAAMVQQVVAYPTSTPTTAEA